MKQFSKWRRVVGALALTVLCLPVPAQPPATPANRVLFVVGTTWAMRQQLAEARASVRELMGSGLQGQLRAGDTIGLWTFDSELRTGKFPMQVWTEGQQGKIVAAMGDFLNQQKATGSAKLEQVLPEVLRLVGESEAITVLLVSDGRGTIRGTPFDDSINEVWRQHWKEMQAAHVPFVTVLVARAGKIVNCNVNPATAVSVPVLPKTAETKSVPAPAPAPPPAPVLAPLPVKTNPPLIVDYSKSNLSAATTRIADKVSESHPGGSNLPPPLPTSEATSPPATPVGELIKSSAPPHLTTSGPVTVLAETNLIPRPERQTVVPAQKIAAPAQGRSRWAGVFIGGGALGLVAVVWWLFTRRRAGARGGGSLITKSFDQGKKR